MSIKYETLDEALHDIIREVDTNGCIIAPRRLETKEITGYSFQLLNPRARLVQIKARKWNYALAVGELCWHLSASDDLDFISYYANTWRSFSDDGIHINGSCYGKKIFSNNSDGKSQWEKLIAQLRRDSSSRRAVITLFDGTKDLDGSLKDVACITSIQFLIRDKKLNCLITIRSNDVIWGLCYDVFLITMLQEILALELNLELGWYQHNTISLHIYKNFYNMADNILNEGKPLNKIAMPKMTHLSCLPEFLKVEKLLRSGKSEGLLRVKKLPKYWRELAEPLINLYEKSAEKELSCS